jgi:hypothetical protein
MHFPRERLWFQGIAWVLGFLLATTVLVASIRLAIPSKKSCPDFIRFGNCQEKMTISLRDKAHCQERVTVKRLLATARTVSLQSSKTLAGISLTQAIHQQVLAGRPPQPDSPGGATATIPAEKCLVLRALHAAESQFVAAKTGVVSKNFLPSTYIARAAISR